MPPKTILHVFPTFAVGGAQSRFASVANHLGRAVRHIVVSLDGRLGAREKLSPTLDVTFATPGGGIRAAAEFLRDAQADLLITSNWGSMDWAIARLLRPRLPHIHTEDGFGPDEQSRQLARRVLARGLILRRSQIVLPSRTLMRLATNTWHLPTAHLHYIPNGIDIARFQAANPAALPAGEGPVIGTIAVLRPEKNLARLIRAFATIRARMPARLVIVGDGPERASLEALAATLGVDSSVLFTGHSTNAETWLAAFDLFALSSDTEQMPLSLLEAMAAGRPVVSTDVGDVRAMLPAESAAFVVPRNEAALADALTTLLTDAPRAILIGQANAIRAATAFDQADMFKSWRKILGIEQWGP